MAGALQPSQNQVYLSRRDAEDVIEMVRPYYADYNADLFAQLDQHRADLDREYFALIDALQDSKPLKTRKCFFRFDDTLSRYLNKNRIELYGYLEKLYQDDDAKMLVIEANMAALDNIIDTISNTLAKYISPSAKYNEKFGRELRAIWTILKGIYYKEKKQLYPLYPILLKSNWKEDDWLKINSRLLTRTDIRTKRLLQA